MTDQPDEPTPDTPKDIAELSLEEAIEKRQECDRLAQQLQSQLAQVRDVALTLDGLIVGLQKGSLNRPARRAAAKKATKRR